VTSLLHDALARVPAAVPLAAGAALAAGMALRAFPTLRAPRPLAGLGLACTIATLGPRLPGFLLVHATVLFFAAGLLGVGGQATAVARARRWRAGLAAIVVVALLFLGSRAYGLDQPGAWGDTGLAFFYLDMWLVLRLVTFLWEAGAGRVGDLTPSRYAAWALLPFTIAGPVVRYSELRPFLAAPAPPARWGAVLRRLAPAALALAAGLVVVPAVDLALARSVHADALGAKALRLFGLGPWGFYWATAGLFGIVEASGMMCGLQIPRSFDSPFGRRNLSEFWARWNMTATRVFREYAFMNRWGLSRPNPYLNSVVVFALCGAWHATNAYWIGWGLLHGVGFAAFLWFKQRAAPRLPEAWGGSLAWRLTSAAGTYAFVCLCWYVPSKLVQRLTG
jgi:D-alanyl-lipoteichoic acid acyltransferase DltB (MBOAT superfamily)